MNNNFTGSSDRETALVEIRKQSFYPRLISGLHTKISYTKDLCCNVHYNLLKIVLWILLKIWRKVHIGEGHPVFGTQNWIITVIIWKKWSVLYRLLRISIISSVKVMNKNPNADCTETTCISGWINTGWVLIQTLFSLGRSITFLIYHNVWIKLYNCS